MAVDGLPRSVKDKGLKAALQKAKKKFEKPEEEAPAEDPGPSEIDLLIEIRDSLKK